MGGPSFQMPKKYTWDSPLDAIRDSIELEHNVTNEIARIHRVAEKTCNDVHVRFFLTSKSKLDSPFR